MALFCLCLQGTAFTLEPLAARTAPRTAMVYDFGPGPVPYRDGLTVQRSLQKMRIAQLREKRPTTADALIVLQHKPVYTLGTASDLANIRDKSPDFDVFRTERGGEVTYHGPGQLILYPILDLHHHRKDVHWYMRALEEVVIRTLGSLGLQGEREPGLTGVWVDGAKVCAIGVKLSRWVTLHGLALNVSPDLSHFAHIVPCGIEDREVTSVEKLLHTQKHATLEHASDLEAVKGLLLHHFRAVFLLELAAADMTPDLFSEPVDPPLFKGSKVDELATAGRYASEKLYICARS